MNDKMNELYIKFHTKRRLFIEKETEWRMDLRIAAGWNNSPSVRKECLYEAMGVRSEVEEFRMFSELIIKECIRLCDEIEDDYLKVEDRNTDSAIGAGTCAYVIEKHFGV